MSLAKANKVAVFFHRLGPYHFARLRAAGQLMAATAIEASNVDEVYCWDQVAGEDGFKRITLCTGEAVRTLPSAELAQRVYSALDQLKPEVVVIAGWAQKEGLAGMQWCMSRQIPVVIMSDSTEWDYFRVPWKEWVKRRILGLCSAAFVAGAPHLDYLVGLGMDRERIFLGFDTVDNSYFKVKSAEAKGQREHYAAEAGLPDRYFLTTARFVQKKNLGRLIDAFGKYRQLARERNPGDLLWSLVLGKHFSSQLKGVHNKKHRNGSQPHAAPLEQDLESGTGECPALPRQPSRPYQSHHHQGKTGKRAMRHRGYERWNGRYAQNQCCIC